MWRSPRSRGWVSSWTTKRWRRRSATIGRTLASITPTDRWRTGRRRGEAPLQPPSHPELRRSLLIPPRREPLPVLARGSGDDERLPGRRGGAEELRDPVGHFGEAELGEQAPRFGRAGHDVRR